MGQYGIDVSIDQDSLDLEGVSTDTEITKRVRKTSLRKGLRRVLDSLPGEVTYIVKNGEVVVTSKQTAEEYLVTKVYNVGDLVVPIGQGFGMGLGGMGGGMGGMGGLGGMGGGMGGMGGGFL